MVQIYKRFLQNAKPILLWTVRISSAFFTVAAIVFSFVGWGEIGMDALWLRILILLLIPVAGFVFSVIYLLFIARRRCLMSRGGARVSACYGDLDKIAKDKEMKIVVIPVNDTFETIVDDDPSISKPLVSPRTIHGHWIVKMKETGWDEKKLDEAIEAFFSENKIVPDKEYGIREKARGKRRSYPIGTVVPVHGTNETVYYLLAVSAFDADNRARSSQKCIRDAVDSLMEFYDKNGQGFDMYIPLLGTGLSGAGLSHEESLRTIEGTVLTNEKTIRGHVNIVVYIRDREKVSIFL